MHRRYGPNIISSESKTIGDALMKRIAFVTGATGFLGLNLIERLRSSDWEVVAFHVPDVDLGPLAALGAQLRQGDINDRDSLARAMPERVDAVFHVAGNTSTWSANDERQYRDNVEGTRNVVEACLSRGARRLVYTSSISAYGHQPGIRIAEGSVSNALATGMGYHRSKFIAEGVVKSACLEGLSAAILNPCNILGPRDLRNWTAQFILPVYEGRLRAVPPGRATWCHVSDVADAHIAAVDAGGSGENYLLGGVEASFLDVVNAIEGELGMPRSTMTVPAGLLRLAVLLGGLKSRIDGKEPALTIERYRRAVGNMICDCSKARRELSYRETSLPVMVADTVAWLRAEKLLCDRA
jgi:dihydroflavonol-4-reductase